MKIKIILVAAILATACLLQSKVVATVEGRQISEQMLQDKISEFDDEYATYGELKKAALDELINEALLLNYAAANQIDIDQFELDAFFYSQLGDHPNFQQDGEFSQAKYENFKFTNRGKRILSEMERELLLSKVKELIIKDFNLTDQYLYQKFLIENRQIVINYAMVDIAKVNIPLHYTVEGALRYFENQRQNILTEEKIKLDFYYFAKSDYLNAAQIFIVADSTQSDSLSSMLLDKEATRLARQEADKLLTRLRQNQLAGRPLFSSGYLKKGEAMGIISPEITAEAFREKPQDFSQITTIAEGFIIYRVSEVVPPKKADLAELKDQVWSAYIRDESIKNQQQYEDVFIANIDSFIRPATMVKKIYLDNPSFFSGKSLEEYQQDLSQTIRKNLHNDQALNKIIRANKLVTENVAIYQNPTQNIAPEDRLISARLANGKENGVLQYGSEMIVYKATLFFPEYIPPIADILPELQELISDIKFEEADLEDFYAENKAAFVTSDSLKLGICYFPKVIEDFSIADSTLQQHYNQQDFYRERSVKYDLIYTPHRKAAELACNYYQQGIDFGLLKEIYSEDYLLTPNRLVEYEKLPKQLIDILQPMQNHQCSQPIAYDDGWLLLVKYRDYPAGIATFQQVKDQIAAKIKDQQAELIAYQNARTVFDSTRYFSQAIRFANQENIHKTQFQDAYEDFEILGNISNHRRELMRIWPNEKYSRIIDTGQGFAVVYLLKKRSSQDLDFQQAKPRIKQMMIAQDHIEKAREYTERLAERIANGADAEKLLYFVGSWQQARINSLDNDIFDSKFSQTIIQDITKHQTGYFSPIIKLEDDRFIFYEIEQMNKISRQEYQSQKLEYRQKVTSELMENWLERAKNISQIDRKAE